MAVAYLSSCSHWLFKGFNCHKIKIPSIQCISKHIFILTNNNFIGIRSYCNNKYRMSHSKSKPFSLSNSIVDNSIMLSDYITININEIARN